jgi:hypothetical protein
MDDQVESIDAMYKMYDRNQMEYVNVNNVNEFE